MTTANEIIMYSTKDLEEIFLCGKNQAYAIMNTPGFPRIRVGKRLLVEKRALEKWLTMNQGKTVFTS